MQRLCSLLINVARLSAGRTIICALAAVLLAAAAVAEEPSGFEGKLPRTYNGQFYWERMSGTQFVEIRINTTRQVDPQRVEATGCGRYVTGETVTTIGVRMMIDVASLDIEIWESDPDRTFFTTDGSHKGKLSDDLQSIEAEWTTTTTGEKGRLRLWAGGPGHCSGQVA